MSQGLKMQNGFELPEGRYVNGIAMGVNFTNVNGVIATGTTQTTASPIPPGYFMVSVDTSTASTGLGLNLPFAVAGTQINIYNNTANTITIYPSVANNPATGAQDTINTAATSITIVTHNHGFLFCPKTGNWSF